MKNYYQTLGLEPSASLDQIKSAYRKLAKKFHPDMNSQDQFFENMFKEIQTAYDILSDVEKKKTYDIRFAEKVTPQDNRSLADKEADEFIAAELPVITLFSLIISADESDSSAAVLLFKELYRKKLGAGKAFLAVYKLKELIAGNQNEDLDKCCQQVNLRYTLGLRRALFRELLKCCPLNHEQPNEIKNQLVLRIAQNLQLPEQDLSSIFPKPTPESIVVEKTTIEQTVKEIQKESPPVVKTKSKKNYFLTAITVLVIIMVTTFLTCHNKNSQELEFIVSGKQALELKDFDLAAEYFENARKLNSENSAIYLGLGAANNGNGNYNTAIEFLQKALELEPENSDIYFQLGVAYLGNQNPDQALESFKKVLEGKPNHEQTLLEVGKILIKKSDLDQAINCFKLVLKNKPNQQEALFQLAKISDSQGKYDLAIDYYLQLLRVTPEDADVNYNIAVTYYSKGQDSIALIYYTKAAQLGMRLAQNFLRQNQISY